MRYLLNARRIKKRSAFFFNGFVDDASPGVPGRGDPFDDAGDLSTADPLPSELRSSSDETREEAEDASDASDSEPSFWKAGLT